MAVATVTIANAFNGLNTWAWTGWVWFAVSIGIILVWAYTVRMKYEGTSIELVMLSTPFYQAIYSIISPGWIVTPVL